VRLVKIIRRRGKAPEGLSAHSHYSKIATVNKGILVPWPISKILIFCLLSEIKVRKIKHTNQRVLWVIGWQGHQDDTASGIALEMQHSLTVHS